MALGVLGVLGRGLGLGGLLVEVWDSGALGSADVCPRRSWGHLCTGSLGLHLWLEFWALALVGFLGSGFWELRGIGVRPG